MYFSYNRLWKKLIDVGWNKTDLKNHAGLSNNVISRLSKNETVSMESLFRICVALKCEIEDVVEVVDLDKGKTDNI